MIDPHSEKLKISDQKFSYKDTKKADRTVSIPKMVSGQETYRIIKYVALALLAARYLLSRLPDATLQAPLVLLGRGACFSF